MDEWFAGASGLLIPGILCITGILFWRNGLLYDSFVRGAMRGLETCRKLLPPLVLFMAAIQLFLRSGAAEACTALLSPWTERLGIPGELVPLLLLRPVSGSAASAGFASLLQSTGVQSRTATAAAILMASSDTLLYVISVYYSATRVKRTRHTLPVALSVSVLAVFLSCMLA